MKKSKTVKLVLVTALATSVTSCRDKEKEKDGWNQEMDRLHVRTDTTGPYTRGHHYMPFFHFYPYGTIFNGGYYRGGYGGSGLSARSSAEHGSYARGGFGRSGFHASS